MPVTIKDIAKHAGVSIATVSMVLNNKDHGITQKTRDKILKIAEELNYRPNRLARGLVTKRTNTLGFILPDITNPFFPEIVRAAEDTANKYDYNLILCNTDDDEDKEKLYIEVLKEKCVDGIIFTSSIEPSEENLKTLLDYDIPFVFLDRFIDIDKAYVIHTDGMQGMYEVVKYLIDMGHEKIAFLSGPFGSSTACERYKGYAKALKECGISIDKNLIVEGDYKEAGGKRAMRELLKRNTGFTAVACANDLMAIGAMEVLKQNNIRIPEEVSITGFDDIALSKVLDPKLTTVSQPCYDMGHEATKMLIKLIEGKTPEKNKQVLKPKLVIRDSVAL